MTYLQFLILFVVFPAGLLALRYPRLAPTYPGARPYLYIPAIAVIAVAYTTPWDNYLVKSGVWWYADGAVLGTIGYVPIEEYLFFLFQPVLSGLVFYHAVQRIGKGGNNLPLFLRVLVPVVLAAGLLAGLMALRTSPGRYLGLILTWSVPILAIQWVVGSRILRRMSRPVWFAVAISSAYLWLADGFAINTGIWTISEQYTLGWSLFGLPIEEAVFFFVTNIMVVQGLALFLERTSRRS
jgi:lycopene cyclase domain-containing protein